LDFSVILSVTSGQQPSIVQIRAQGLDIAKIAELITLAVAQHKDEIEKGAILSIDAKNSRLRLLPL